MTTIQTWRRTLGLAVCVLAGLILRSPASAQTIIMAQLRTDEPVRGWPDATKVVHQIAVMSPSNASHALENHERTRRRVENQVKRVYNAYGQDAMIYIDFEPGNDDADTPEPEGWLRRDAQDFAIELLGKYRNAWLFPGVAFDTLVQKDPDAARRVAAAATNGVLFPVYQGVLDFSKHEKLTRRRLDRLVDAGIKFTPIAWRQYHEAAPQGYARTDIPLKDFVAGLQLAAEYSDVVVVWGWKPAGWDKAGTDETAVVQGVKDQVLRNPRNKGKVPPEDKPVTPAPDPQPADPKDLRAEKDAVAAALDRLNAHLNEVDTSLGESQTLIDQLQQSLAALQALIAQMDESLAQATQSGPADLATPAPGGGGR
jgi:hypothetical protein